MLTIGVCVFLVLVGCVVSCVDRRTVNRGRWVAGCHREGESCPRCK